MTAKTNTIFTKISNVRFLTIAFVVGSFVLFCLFIWQVNVAATKGFAMREVEDQIEELERENARLAMEIAELQSVQSVSSRIKLLGLTPVERVEYVSPGIDAVAIR